jgi:hypothetical protein
LTTLARQDRHERHTRPVQRLEQRGADIVGRDEGQGEGEHTRHPRRARREIGRLAGGEIERLGELQREAEHAPDREGEDHAAAPDPASGGVVARAGLARDQHRHPHQEPDRHGDQAVLDRLAEHVIGKLGRAGPAEHDDVDGKERDDADPAQDHRPGKRQRAPDVPAQRVLVRRHRGHGAKVPAVGSGLP